jgi:hypothetical protein
MEHAIDRLLSAEWLRSRWRATTFRRIILVGATPRGGEDIMHLDKPTLARHLSDPALKGYSVFSWKRSRGRCSPFTKKRFPNDVRGGSR